MNNAADRILFLVLVLQGFPTFAAAEQCRDDHGTTYICGVESADSVRRAQSPGMPSPYGNNSGAPVWKKVSSDAMPEKYQGFAAAFIGIKRGDGLSQVEKLYGPLRQGCVQLSDPAHYGQKDCTPNRYYGGAVSVIELDRHSRKAQIEADWASGQAIVATYAIWVDVDGGAPNGKVRALSVGNFGDYFHRGGRWVRKRGGDDPWLDFLGKKLDDLKAKYRLDPCAAGGDACLNSTDGTGSVRLDTLGHIAYHEITDVTVMW